MKKFIVPLLILIISFIVSARPTQAQESNLTKEQKLERREVKFNERLSNFGERVTARFLNMFSRLENFADRIKARIEANTNPSYNKDEALKKLEQVKKEIVLGKEAASKIAAELSSIATPTPPIIGLGNLTAIRDTRAHLRQAHQLLVELISKIKTK